MALAQIIMYVKRFQSQSCKDITSPGRKEALLKFNTCASMQIFMKVHELKEHPSILIKQDHLRRISVEACSARTAWTSQSTKGKGRGMFAGHHHVSSVPAGVDDAIITTFSKGPVGYVDHTRTCSAISAYQGPCTRELTSATFAREAASSWISSSMTLPAHLFRADLAASPPLIGPRRMR
mmetsp:Transcript_25484/g.30935  ORF Transcript_25484/g.30935 Transcript_25484/m.30935 type:complete len:180 (+) Transcript_25484:339-878(+)